MCVTKTLGLSLNSQSIKRNVSTLYQVFVIVAACVWLVCVKEIEYQNLVIKDLLVKTKCCNEPDAAALKQPFSLAFLNMREFNLNFGMS